MKIKTSFYVDDNFIKTDYNTRIKKKFTSDLFTCIKQMV